MRFSFNDLLDKKLRFCIFGGNMSGKTYLSKYILKLWGNKGIAFDKVEQYRGFHRYNMNIKVGTLEGRKEMDNAIKGCLLEQKWENNHRFKGGIFDEANEYFPTNIPLLPYASKLNNEYRHIINSFGMISRRPARLYNDFVDLAHVLFIFRLTGKNDKKYLNDVHDGLGEMASNLQKYHFIVYQEGEEPYIHEPITFRK